VVLETVASGVSSLPFPTFVVMMQSIHLGIGVVEGVVTAAVVSFVYKARPELMQSSPVARPVGSRPVRGVLLAFLAVAMLAGGVVSWFASEDPDGLEWAIAKVTGKEELTGDQRGLHGVLASLQKKIAFLPEYSFKKPAAAKTEEAQPAGELNKERAKAEGEQKNEEGSRLGTSVSGIVGALITLAIALLAGFLLKKRHEPV